MGWKDATLSTKKKLIYIRDIWSYLHVWRKPALESVLLNGFSEEVATGMGLGVGGMPIYKEFLALTVSEYTASRPDGMLNYCWPLAAILVKKSC